MAKGKDPWVSVALKDRGLGVVAVSVSRQEFHLSPAKLL